MSDEPTGMTWHEPLAYHREVVAVLRETEPEVWRWAASAEAQSGHVEEIRTRLLKSTYRLDAEGHPALHGRLRTVAARLQVDTPVHLYQANGAAGMNAALCHLPGEAHIVFSGPVLSVLQDAELDAVLAHELAHHRLWEMDGGAFLTADRILAAAADDPRGGSSHAVTARRFRLYAEIFADRGSLAGCGDLLTTVAALVKVETGLGEVSAPGYLRQADEIFAREDARTAGLDHPETFIRARALRLWRENAAALDAWLRPVIEGPLAIDDLDLAGQVRLRDLTRRLLGQLLRPRWFQSDAALAHARAFFPAFAPSPDDDAALAEALRTDDAATREYLCYVLLDFAAVDADLGELPLAAALVWSARLGLGEMFEKIAAKELGLGRRQLAKAARSAAEQLERAEAGP